MKIRSLYRYPVKGLTPERLAQATLSPGRCIPWDRAFALAQGDAPLDPEHPAWISKTNFMCLARNAKAALLNTSFDESAGTLAITSPDGAAITASPFVAEGRAALTSFLTAFLGQEARYGVTGQAPQFHYFPQHSFCDHKTQVVSFIGLGSLSALEQAVGTPRDVRRFRANIYIDDIAPWAEFSLLGKTLAIGDVRMVVQERIDRCAATTVNPDTAARDANPVKELQQNFGHVDLGVFAEILCPGEIRPGDEIKVVE
jgi:uncharacterized protein YcbX